MTDCFPHAWQAEILPARPLILPPRHFIYPREADEVERGAFEIMIRPLPTPQAEDRPPAAQEFLATCALGFRDPSVPTGVWSAPNPHELCAVSGGYVYLIDTTTPQRFTMIPYRPVLEVRPAPERRLLLFVGHRSILAWGDNGQAWESPKLSDEGLTITTIDGPILHGLGWNMLTDRETPFALDLQSGAVLPVSS
jgi:hypothetical protein